MHHPSHQDWTDYIALLVIAIVAIVAVVFLMQPAPREMDLPMSRIMEESYGDLGSSEPDFYPADFYPVSYEEKNENKHFSESIFSNS